MPDFAKTNIAWLYQINTCYGGAMAVILHFIALTLQLAYYAI